MAAYYTEPNWGQNGSRPRLKTFNSKMQHNQYKKDRTGQKTIQKCIYYFIWHLEALVTWLIRLALVRVGK